MEERKLTNNGTRGYPFTMLSNLPRPHVFIIPFLLVQTVHLEAADFPAGKLSPTARLKTVHLKAAHEDAERLQKMRKALPSLKGLQDYKAILHAHAEDSAHTGGTRPEMLADAKKAGVQIIMLTDHLRPPRDFMDSWRGLHDGVLFIPGSEAKGFLVYPSSSILDRMEAPKDELIQAVTANNGLIFLSHIEERKNHAMDRLTGLEIYNRHFDAKKDMAGLIALAMRLLDPKQLAELEEDVRLYPDEVLAAQVTYQDDYIQKWDAESQTRKLTGVAANDCHHNQIMIVKMVDEDTVLVGTNVDEDKQMRKMTADSKPTIRELTKGHKAGDILAKVDFDPYYRSFRNSATHILAPVLTEPATRSALQAGHAFVSHDWMCDASGFSFQLTNRKTTDHKLMGDEVQFAEGQKLVAQFPVSCHARLLKNGKAIAESDGDTFEQEVGSAGIYRLEAWLKVDGEDRPWIYANPIYVR
jgi:hypothetical protein